MSKAEDRHEISAAADTASIDLRVRAHSERSKSRDKPARRVSRLADSCSNTQTAQYVVVLVAKRVRAEEVQREVGRGCEERKPRWPLALYRQEQHHDATDHLPRPRC